MCQDHAKGKGGKCLSTEYVNNKTKMKWKCKEGHQWEATPKSVLNSGSWCRHCLLLGIKTCQDHAESKGGKCLSEEYVNSKTKMKWKCKEGHQWEATPDSVLSGGSWCPECKNKTQGVLREIVENIFPNKKISNNFRGFDWLKDKGRMEIDIWLPELKLAIEYDGEQHSQSVCFGGVSESQAQIYLLERMERDTLKNRLIKKHKKEVEYFIRFSHKDDLTKKGVIKKLKQNKVPLPKRG
jgi:hypothetical protein